MITPSTYILAIILAALIVVAGAYGIGQSIWTALAALGTVGAVIWAVFHQGLLEWWKRPILEFLKFKQEPPCFRQAPEFDNKGKMAAFGYYVNIPLRNHGKTVLKHCEPVITKMGNKHRSTWQQDKNWLPKGLRWSFEGEGEQNLVPERPYAFSLGKLSTQHPNLFSLSVTYPTTGQPSALIPGEYCFEIRVFGEKAEPITNYFHVEWQGGTSQDFNAVNTVFKIYPKDNPPWPT